MHELVEPLVHVTQAFSRATQRLNGVRRGPVLDVVDVASEQRGDLPELVPEHTRELGDGVPIRRLRQAASWPVLTIPERSSLATSMASLRERTSSLRKMFLTWERTVSWESTS